MYCIRRTSIEHDDLPLLNGSRGVGAPLSAMDTPAAMTASPPLHQLPHNG